MEIIDPHYQNDPEYRGRNIHSMPPNWSLRTGIVTILIALVIAAVLVVWNLISNQPTQPIKEPENGWATILPLAQQWKLRSAETFDTENETWKNGSQRTSLADRKFQIVGGKYRVEVLAKDSLIAHLGPEDVSIPINFYVAVDGGLASKSQGAYGLEFYAARLVSSKQYYVFLINGNAYTFLAVKDDAPRTVIDWTETSFIRPGQMNHIAVVGAGTHYVFFINDQYVDQANDDEFSLGSAGLLISMDKSDDTVVYEFDNFELRVP